MTDEKHIPGLGHNQPPEPAKPIRCFQRYTSEQRANHAASRRLGHLQREAVGEFYWIHPDVPGIAFPTRKTALKAAARSRGESDE